MTDRVRVGRRRTGWDVLWGIVIALLGIVVLGHVVLATAISVLFLGWFTLFAGVAALVAALFRIGKGGFWATALTGGLLLVLGLMLVRNPGAGAVTLTLLAGALFLAGGVTRLVAAAESPVGRGLLIFDGIVSLVLGLIVLFNFWEASLTLLGLLLGIQILIDGITLALFGRVRVDRVPSADHGEQLPS